MKEFDSWNELKKKIDQTEFNHFFHEREVWWCSLGINIGNEADGKNHFFERPVLIFKIFNKSTALILPLSSKIKTGYFYFCYSRAGSNYSANLSQLRLISTKRLLRRMYKLDSNVFSEIRHRIKSFL